MPSKYLLLDYVLNPYVIVLAVVVVAAAAVVAVVKFGCLVTFLRFWSLTGWRHSISPKVFNQLSHGRWQVFHLNNNNIIVICPTHKHQYFRQTTWFSANVHRMVYCNDASKVDELHFPLAQWKPIHNILIHLWSFLAPWQPVHSFQWSTPVSHQPMWKWLKM